MKSLKIRPSVRVVVNTNKIDSHRWARIIDAKTGKVLHTGQVPYIVRTAQKRYGVIVGSA